MAVISPAKRNSFTPMKAQVGGPAVPVVTPLQSAASSVGLQGLSTSNPPFAGSVAGWVAHTASQSDPGASHGTPGVDERIVRGYIRRADDSDTTDPTSRYRLNFMYNPETVQRSFISYLDQGALDPFNTVHGSGNITAPPGILDFSFELLFDRQLEVFRNDNHPGTKVDYDYFDLVVRGVQPGVPGAIPDNGVMMVNPRNITVVFGPELVVTGKPYNASVSFDKFSHRMTPTRIRIQLQMKVFSIGPRPLPYTYQTAQDQHVVAATVPYDNKVVVNITSGDAIENLLGASAAAALAGLGIDTNSSAGDTGTPSNLTGATGTGTGGGGAAWNGPIDEKRILARIRTKESGSNYASQSKYSSASGAYQFIDTTWNRYKGYARAYMAPPAVQDERALQDVRHFLGLYNNVLESVPASWYVGSYKGHGRLNYFPGGKGNRETVQQYVDDWLAGY